MHCSYSNVGQGWHRSDCTETAVSAIAQPWSPGAAATAPVYGTPEGPTYNLGHDAPALFAGQLGEAILAAPLKQS